MTNSENWEKLQQVINRRFAEQKDNRYVDEIVYQNEENTYFEQIKDIHNNANTGTQIILIICVNANGSEGWRVEFTTEEQRPQDTSKYFHYELDARIFLEMLEAGKYEAALIFARLCFDRAMKASQ